MNRIVSRRVVLAAPLAGSAILGAGYAFGQEIAPVPATAPAIPPDFPRQPPDLVREVVGAAHRDLARVKALVAQRPALANAAWDWGFGDWETPLGAAAHTGRRPIAEFLLASGARLDIFAAAMLGQLDVVKAIVAATPGIQRTRGPHGIPLLSHARAGGDEAVAVADYLASLGDAGEASTPAKADDSLRQSHLGTYSYGAGPTERFSIAANRDDILEIKREGGNAQRLFVAGPREYHPPGAPAVRIRFEGDAAASARVVVVDGELTVVGRRV